MNSNKENYQNATQYYDACFAYRQDTSFYINMIDKHGTNSVLELGCGTGRITFAAKDATKYIIGMDSNKPRIDYANEKLSHLKGNSDHISFVEGDMRKFQLEKKFDLIIIPFRGFQHILNKDDQRRVFECVFEHLNSGGHFIFDLFNPSIPTLANNNFDEFSENIEIELGEEKVSLSGRLKSQNYFEQTLSAEEIYNITDESGKKKKLVLSFETRYSFKEELTSLLELCMFDVGNIWGDFSCRQFGESNYPGEIIIDAVKK